MNLFNIIVGIATIISTICSIISVTLLNSLTIKINNTGVINGNVNGNIADNNSYMNNGGGNKINILN